MAEQRTTDHNTIRKWAEERDGKPSVVKKDGKQTELIRLDFPGYTGKDLKEISWDKWFELFEENDLELLYQEETESGEKSNFNKLVNRN